MRRRPEKPLVKQAAEFVMFQLADKRAFHPFTGSDWDAWHAYIPLIRLWGRSRSDDVAAALRAVVHAAQIRNLDVMAVFKKAIPCILDWSDEPALWQRIAPRDVVAFGEKPEPRMVMGTPAVGKRVWSGPDEITVIMWPCPDGARVCHHENSRPYKSATPEPGYTLDQECRDCGAVWRQKITAVTTTT
jgi:hypothetical protein